MSATKTIIRTHKYRLYPSKEQEAIFSEWLETCRHLYNYFVQQRFEHWEIEKHLPKGYRTYISYFDQCKQLPELKKDNHYLKRAYAAILVDVAKRVDKTFLNFIREISKGNSKYGKPKFKHRLYYNSFTYPQPGIKQQKFRIEKNRLYLGKIGHVKIILDKELPQDAILKTCTIKREVNQWYAHISFNQIIAVPELKINENKAIGIDLGIKTYGVLSNGKEIKNPKWLQAMEKKLVREQKNLSRKKKGSKNWKKQLIKLSKIYRKIRFQRNDFLHKETTKLANDYDLIVLENLRISNLIRNSRLAKNIGEVSWGIFQNILSYKVNENGKKLITVNPRNTSQICSNCGEIVRKSLKVRIHECPNCNIVLDRDLNAAKNILQRGLEKLRSSIDDTVGLTGSACGEVSEETQGSKKFVESTNKPKLG
ncbi:MAG: RNA-guided endonuclease InsQ/TnpB family protein [Candidatus Heimdallarchaeota archaeon]